MVGSTNEVVISVGVLETVKRFVLGRGLRNLVCIGILIPGNSQDETSEFHSPLSGCG